MPGAGERLFERYRLVERLGRGAQGETWVAHDERQGDEVALKVFSLAGLEDWKSFDLFERECRVLRSLEHPAIPRYRDHGGDEEQGTFYLAMQRVHGQTLSQALAEGHRMSEERLLDVLDQLLAVLEYLHGLRPAVIHRDINPNNVILDDEGGVYLADFGGVREVFGDEQASTIIGTHGYMAPEQLHGEAGPGSDVYALGATTLAMMTGVPATDLPRQGIELDVARVLPEPRLRELLASMVRIDPRRRTSSASQLRRELAALRAVANRSDGSILFAEPHLPAPRAPSRATANALMPSDDRRSRLAHDVLVGGFLLGGSGMVAALFLGSGVFSVGGGIAMVLAFVAHSFLLRDSS